MIDLPKALLRRGSSIEARSTKQVGAS